MRGVYVPVDLFTPGHIGPRPETGPKYAPGWRITIIATLSAIAWAAVVGVILLINEVIHVLR